LTLLIAMLGAVIVIGASGFLCAAIPRSAALRDTIFALLMISAGVAGASCALWSIISGAEAHIQSEWFLPIGRVAIRLDTLGALFLVPIFLVPALGALYGSAYWSEREHPESAPRLRIFYGLMTAGMAGVILAQNGVLLLLAWEVMAVAAFFAIATQDTLREVRDAAWVYFVATHVGTLFLFAFITLLAGHTGSFDLVPIADSAGWRSAGSGGGMAGVGGVMSWLFGLGLIGFGVKAGIMPLHVWLPGAHASAPSHVSALLSGVMLKVGVYGIFRLCWMLPPGPLWWGGVLIALGAASAVLGIAFALGQRDYKRLLAYSSIENIGVIILGLGVAMLGRSSGHRTLETLALAGAMLHVWNHSLFKPLLFLVAGAVLHCCGTRRMNALGGLARRMPLTAVLAALACAALAALPPLNGFASEWLIYRSAFEGLLPGSTAALVPLAGAVLALALTGALALAAFVKFHATIFLGQERSPATMHAHDPALAMLVPMGVLALGCLGVGVFISPALRPIGRAVAFWTGASPAASLALSDAASTLGWASLTGVAVVGLGFVIVLRLRGRSRAGDLNRAGTWGCGYVAPTPRMQYSESSFSELIANLFGGLLMPRRKGPRIESNFPGPAAFESDTPDVVLDRGMAPLLEHAANWATRLRVLQRGRVQTSALYIFAGLLTLLAMC